MRKHIDHSGETYGRLTLIERAPDKISNNGKRHIQYYCICSCGKYTEDNPKIINWDNIKSGNTKSCGCLNSELASKRMKKYNTYNLSGEYGIGYTSKNEEFYFDLEDYNKIKDYCWCINTLGYVVGSKDSSKKTLMHRLIMDFPDNYVIDHIHGKQTRNDNRKSNLRLVTHSQNHMNTAIRQDNLSGATGVCNIANKWRAFITVNQKTISLGNFDNFDDAVKARKIAEEKYFGEYSYNNSVNI